MRIAFFGTPHFGLPCLEMLVQSHHEIVGVFCQPDRKSGRGHKIIFPPIKQCAIENDLPVFQYEKIKSAEAIEELKDINFDLMITAAYGQILSAEILDIPKSGCINVHASLLPKYRGAAPIQWVIMNGEQTTGITTMFTDIGLDTGDMLLKDETSIGDDETGGQLYERLSILGATTLKRTLDALEKSELIPEKQLESESSYYPLLKKEMAKLSFELTAKQLVDKVRALDPVIKCYARYKGNDIKLLKLKVIDTEIIGKAGEVLISNHKDGLVIMSADKAIEVIDIQAPGSKRMRAKDYLLGKQIPVGDIFE